MAGAPFCQVRCPTQWTLWCGKRAGLHTLSLNTGVRRSVQRAHRRETVQALRGAPTQHGGSSCWCETCGRRGQERTDEQIDTDTRFSSLAQADDWMPGQREEVTRQVTEINDASFRCAQNSVGDPKMAQRLNWGGGEGREVRTSHIGRMVYSRAAEGRSLRRRTSPNRSQGSHSGLSQGQLGWMLEGTERRFYAILGSVSLEIWTQSARNGPK